MRQALFLCLNLGMALASGDAGPKASSQAPPRAEAKEVVILVHGMGRTRLSMMSLARTLQEAGYETLRYGYPSRRTGVAKSAERLSRRISEEAKRPDIARIHLVGHSLGNILIRGALAHDRPDKIGRVVMLAPPNQGAAMADRFAPLFSWMSKPLPDLTTSPGSLARTIPDAPGVEIGVIAGSLDPVVKVAETHLAGETDHIVVRSSHTFIMRKRQVRQLTLRFIRTGSFQG